MTWRIWCRPWDSGQLANTDIFQPVTPKKNIILIGCRTWIVAISDPTFTDLNMKIYSNDDNAAVDTPLELLATSTNSQAKADIITLDHGVKEIYFNFDNVSLQENTKYNFVMNGTGYVPTSSSFLCWRKAYPDPVYTAGYTPTKESLGVAPYEIYLIGGDL